MSFRIRVIHRRIDEENAEVVIQCIGSDADEVARELGQLLADGIVTFLAKPPTTTRAPSCN